MWRSSPTNFSLSPVWLDTIKESKYDRLLACRGLLHILAQDRRQTNSLSYLNRGTQMSQESKLRCPLCGADMNRHATKVDYGTDDLETGDPVFGGELKEAYYCPHCGHTELKAAS